MHCLPLLIEHWLSYRLHSGEITGRTRTLLAARFRDLYRVVGDTPVSQIDRSLIRRWWRQMGNYSPATRRAYLSTTSLFFRWCVEEGILEADPTEHLPRVKEPRRVPRARPADDVRRILVACATDRETLIVLLMVQLGLRACEVARLELADYDQTANTLLIRGKGSHERMLPVPAAAALAIVAYCTRTGWAAGPLIRSDVSTRSGVTGDRVAQVVGEIMRRAGVKKMPHDGISGHALRHTAASDVLDRCHDVRTVQVMLGHANLNTTQVYLRRASLDQLREAMEGRDYAAA